MVSAPDSLLKANTLFLESLPDIGITLISTSVPARCYFASDGRGYEVIVENLPLHITFKPTFLTPPAGSGSVGDTTGFDLSQPDSIAVVQNPGPVMGTELYIMTRLRLTPDGDVILEASSRTPRATSSSSGCRQVQYTICSSSPRRGGSNTSNGRDTRSTGLP